MPGIRLWKNPIALPILLPLFLQIAPAQSISGPDKVQVNKQASYSTTLGATDLQCPVDENGDPLTPSSTITYTWTFSDDQSTTSTTDGTASVNHTFKTKGTYTVTVDLKAPVQEPGYDGQYCTATASLSVTAFTLSITASKSAIAAGAVANDAHQTSVSVTTDPAVNIPLKVVVHGGAGVDPPYTEEYPPYAGFSYGKPATLIFNQGGQLVGSNSSSPPSLTLTTGADGALSGTLTSSDKVENISIDASYNGGSTQTTSISFGQCSYSWTMPNPQLTYGQQGTATLNTTFNGIPVPGHRIAPYVKTVTVGTTTHTSSLSDDLSLYVHLLDTSYPLTDNSGNATIHIKVQNQYMTHWQLDAKDIEYSP